MKERAALWAHRVHGRYARKSEGGRRLFLWALYTALFLLGAAIAFSVFALKGKGVIWTYDSSGQYYLGMIRFAEALRRFFAGLMQGRLEWAQFDFSIGFGEDIIASLNYYGFGDPLYLLAALTPRALAQHVFAGLVFLRVYLAGLFFFPYIRWFGVRRGSALLGAVSYALCGYAVLSISAHQIFLNAVMYLPLILLGFEHLLKGRRPVLLPVVTALFALTGYYMLYMVSLFLAIYAAFRFFADFSRAERKASAFFRLFFVAAGYYVLGVCAAGIVLLPAVWGFLHRITADHVRPGNLLYYPLRTYISELPKLIFFDGQNLRGFAIWSLCAMLLVVVKPAARRRYLGVAAALGASAFLLVPFLGYMFNGFSYDTNRWSYLLSFLSACALSVMLEDTFSMKKGAWTASVCTVSALFLMFAGSQYAGKGNLSMEGIAYIAYAALAALATFAAIGWIGKISRDRQISKGARRVLALAVCAIVVTGNLGVNGLVQNIARVRSGDLIDMGAVDRMIAASPANAVQAPADAGFFRIEVPIDEWADRNDGLALGLNATAAYLSVMNENPLEGLSGLELSSRTLLNQVMGLDAREALLALLNVRYYAKRADSPQQAPYGFIQVAGTGANEVYENQNALPIAYSTDHIINYEAYLALTGLERQQALLKGAVLQSGGGAPAESEIESLAYAIEPGADAHWTDGALAGKKGAEMAITFSAPAGAETYIRFTGLVATGIPKDYGEITIIGEGFKKTLVLNREGFVHGHGEDTFLINLGHHTGPLTRAVIRFEQDTSIRLEGIEVLSVPMDDFAASVQALKAQAMTDVAFGTDRIEGSVGFDAQRALVFGIPYSEGWRAEVDGVETPIDPSTGFVMALTLPAGEHRVVLVYDNPWRMAGVLMSLAAIAALMGMLLCGVRFRAGHLRPRRNGA
jgi:uncharacterized membrane protein YfhO